jgi:hypothetical protein
LKNALSADRQAVLAPLWRAMPSVNEPLAAVEQRTPTVAQAEEGVERLRMAPGVDPLTARSLVVTLDEGER